MKNGKHTDTAGTEHWYQNGKLHRTDGPAAIYVYGTEYWYLNGEKHRTDGPAVTWADGEERWYQNGKELTESEILIKKEGIEFDDMMREMLSEDNNITK